MIEVFEKLVWLTLNIIEKIGPTLATLLAVYLAYRYAKKQKLLENKHEEHRKIRIAVSNLLQIWRELSMIEFYINSEKFFAELIFKNPAVAANYFNIDLKRIKSFRRLFNQSKEEIKALNVALFYNLENSIMEFNKAFRFFDTSGAPPQNEHLKEMVQGVLKELVRDLENIIKNTAEHLADKEQAAIASIISEHHRSLTKTNIDYEVPSFLLQLINQVAPVKESITSEEIAVFSNDHTVRMLISKAAPIIFHIFLRDHPQNIVSVLDGIFSDPEKFGSSIDAEELVLSVDISEEEYDMLVNNKQFYKLVCAIYLKFAQPLPWDFRKKLLQINNGTVNLRNDLEEQKRLIRSKRSNEGETS